MKTHKKLISSNRVLISLKGNKEMNPRIKNKLIGKIVNKLKINKVNKVNKEKEKSSSKNLKKISKYS